MRNLPLAIAQAIDNTARARLALNDATVVVDRTPSPAAYDDLFMAAAAFEAAAQTITEAVEAARRRYALADVGEAS